MARKKTTKDEEGGGFSKMLATTVVLGIVFSAGLITGQRLLRAESRAPLVSLSTARAPSEATEPGAAPRPSLRTTFSFYEHLSQDAEATSPPAPAAVEPPAVEAPKAAVETPPAPAVVEPPPPKVVA